ncbi:hypothetical protein JCM30237_15790 [Halolamina litorea]|uniref:Bacterio-opsin activator domain-containing protein n=1 Tax=Halolamina litorea TaxID=1515593 RepID=A0ABD6BP58_9EURY|nr:bacterio-opsin activator domain-containing protein [Halolamina litorea]
MAQQPNDVRQWPDESDLVSERPTLEGSLTESAFEALPTQIALLDGEGDIIHTNRAWRAFGEENEIVGAPDTIGQNYPAVCRGADDEFARQAYEGLTAVLDGERPEFAFEYPCHGPNEKRWFTMRALPFEHGDERYVLVLHLNITDRKLSELRVDAQNDTLETLNDINDAVRDVIDSLLGEVNRGEVEAAVCERLADSRLYQTALTVTAGLTGESGRVRKAAGELDAERVDAGSLLEGGVADAIEDGEPRVFRHAAENEAVPERLRTLADEAAVEAYATVPLAYRGTTYGALVVTARRPDAFDERERTAFTLLGETVGYAIDAIQSKRVLQADALTQLRFDVSDDTEFLVRAADETGASLELEGLVPSAEGVIGYFHVEDADPAALVAAAGDDPTVTNARAVVDGDDDEPGLFECTITGDSALVALSGYGASVVSASVEGGEMELTAVVAPEADVRSIVEAVSAAVPENNLTAKRETEGTITSMTGFRDRLYDELTDRQREILEAAYFGGYFEQPRRSSGTELADSFGVSSPTFHQHLQAALRKLTALSFETAEN